MKTEFMKKPHTRKQADAGALEWTGRGKGGGRGPKALLAPPTPETIKIAVTRARMELKTTKAAKELLSMAAAAEGMDLTSFVLGVAMEKARRVLTDNAAIALTREGQLTLARLINNPRKPSDAMRELMNLPDLPRA